MDSSDRSITDSTANPTGPTSATGNSDQWGWWNKAQEAWTSISEAITAAYEEFARVAADVAAALASETPRKRHAPPVGPLVPVVVVDPLHRPPDEISRHVRCRPPPQMCQCWQCRIKRGEW